MSKISFKFPGANELNKLAHKSYYVCVGVRQQEQ